MKHIRSWVWIDFRFIDSSTISYVNSCIRIQPWFHNILHNTELMNEFMIWIYDFKIMIMTSRARIHIMSSWIWILTYHFIILWSCCSGGRVQVWVQIRAPAGHLAITPEGYLRRQSKVLTAKPSNGQALGHALRHSLGGSDGRAQTQGVRGSAPGSRCGPRQARSSSRSLEENVLPLLRYWLSLRVKKVFFLHVIRWWCELNFFRWTGEKFLPTKTALISSLKLSISHWTLSRNVT